MISLAIVTYGCGHDRSAWIDTKDKQLEARVTKMQCPECRGAINKIDSLCGKVPYPEHPVLSEETAERFNISFRSRHCAKPKGIEGWKGFHKELTPSFSEREIHGFWTDLKEGRRQGLPGEALEAWAHCGGQVHAYR